MRTKRGFEVSDSLLKPRQEVKDSPYKCSKCGKPAVGRYPMTMEPRCREHMPKNI